MKSPRPAPTGDAAVFVVVSVDTEEDNWQATRTGLTVENIREIPRLQRLLRQLGVRATYFTNYAVTSTPTSAAILREIAQEGDVEIAAHLHPWNTPPLEDRWQPRDTMLKNLPATLQHAKIEYLTLEHTRVFGRRPTAFRAGRWGLGPDAIRSLAQLGYHVDSSVTPYMDWRLYDEGPDFVGAQNQAYRLDGSTDPRLSVADGPVLEIPASFGYNRVPFARWHTVHERLTSPWARRLRLAGMFHRTGALRKITLSPETDTVHDMLSLSRRLIEQGVRYLHPFWHSPSLRPGLTPFVKTARDSERFFSAIESYFTELRSIAPLKFVTVSEAAAFLEPERVTPAAQRANLAPSGATARSVT